MATKKKASRRRGRAYWVSRVAEYEASDELQADFAERTGLNLGTFRSWIYRLRAETATDGQAAPERPSFVHVVARPGTATSVAGCVVRVGDAEVRFERVPDAVYLAELISGVGA